MRGTAWTIQTSDELTLLAELSSDARFLLQVSRDGFVRVWDLDRRRLVVARQYPRFARALWVGKAVLVISEAATPELLDPFAGPFAPFAGPFAGTIQQVPVGPIKWAVATASGDRVAYLDGHGAANLNGAGHLALWTLPLAAPELRAWLDERTNAATDGEHALVWPWQLPHPR